ncbi:MAG: zinc-ribbon domain-containing protein [Clostridia bacterium]|nr:zinc-ribbon domain-containing protein [Clostridia bacterium]
MTFVVLIVIFAVIGSVIRLGRSISVEAKKDAKTHTDHQTKEPTLRSRNQNGRMYEGGEYGGLAYGQICPYCGNEADSFGQTFCIYCGHRLDANNGAEINKAADKKSSFKNTHVVQPSFGGKHAHMETSITGGAECPPEYASTEIATETPETASACAFDLRYAIIASEILGKPRAMRRYKG